MDINTFEERTGISLEDFGDVVATMEPEELDRVAEYIDLTQQRSDMAERGEDTEAISQQIKSSFDQIKEEIFAIPTFDETNMSRSEYMDALSDTKKSWKEVRKESADAIEKLEYRDYELSLSASEMKKGVDQAAANLGQLKNEIDMLSSKGTDKLSKEENLLLQNMKEEYASTKKDLEEQRDAYLEEKRRLSQNKKELVTATVINDFARTKVSQTLAMQREQILAPARERLEQAQIDLKKGMREFGRDVQTLGSQIKTHFTVGMKVSDRNFTPLRDFREKITNKEIRRQYKHINKAKKVEMKIEKKALRKFNRQAKRDFKEHTRKNNIAKLMGKELPYADIEGKNFQKTQDFKSLKIEDQNKAIESLNGFRRKQMSIIQKDIEYRQGRISKCLEKAVQQRDTRNRLVDQVRDQARDRAEVTFTKDLEKFKTQLDKAEYSMDEKTSIALKDMVERGQIDLDQLTPEAKELLESITGLDIEQQAIDFGVDELKYEGPENEEQGRDFRDSGYEAKHMREDSDFSYNEEEFERG